MICYQKGKETRAEASAVAAREIEKIIEQYYIIVDKSWGFDANSDNGLHDMHYSTKEQELKAEDFIVDGDRVVGYCHEGRKVDFDGSEEVKIYSWNYTSYGGAQDDVDEGDVWIRRRKK